MVFLCVRTGALSYNGLFCCKSRLALEIMMLMRPIAEPGKGINVAAVQNMRTSLIQLKTPHAQTEILLIYPASHDRQIEAHEIALQF